MKKTDIALDETKIAMKGWIYSIKMGGHMKEEIKVTELIETFRDMAKRETLLARGGVSQEDLLIQIEGTIVKVAMR